MDKWCTAAILALKQVPVYYTALKILSGPSRGYELSFGTSLAKLGRLGAENNCFKQTYTKKTIKKN